MRWRACFSAVVPEGKGVSPAVNARRSGRWSLNSSSLVGWLVACHGFKVCTQYFVVFLARGENFSSDADKVVLWLCVAFWCCSLLSFESIRC